MSLMSSFGTGVAAMVAQATAMDVIGQNIANLRTSGYKRAETTFASLIPDFGTTISKPGGVTVQTRKWVEIEGTIESSDRPLDLAISGKGMFVYSTQTTGAGELFFSRKGSLGAVGDQVGVSDAGYLSAFEDLYLMAWPIDGTGAIRGTSARDMVAIPASLNTSFTGRATTIASLSMMLPAIGSTSETIDLYTYDASGVKQPISFTWTKTGNNAWNLEAFDGSNTSISGPTPVTFDGKGDLISPKSITANGVEFDLSEVTQRGNVVFKGLYTQDGLATGDFVDYQVTPDGVIAARFSSGAVTPLYQLPLAMFNNVNALAEYTGNLWAVSPGSGTAEFIPPGTLGRILSGSVEMSNVDLANEFSQMIVTQRAYSSAAQLIQTADEMTQTVRDLR